jgi:hypothetical protein
LLRSSLVIRLRGAQAGFELNLIQFRQQLAGLHMVAVIHIQLFHDAAGFGFHFDLGERLNLARGDDYFGQVTAFRRGQLGRINLVARAQGGKDAVPPANEDQRGNAADDQAPTALFGRLPVC